MKFHFRFFLLHVIFRRNERFIDCLEPVNIRLSHITITSLKICNVSAFQLNILSWTANTMFFSLRGQPFDSEGGGELALFGNKYSGLKKRKINNLSSSGKKINNLTFTFLRIRENVTIFPKIFGSLRSHRFNFQILFSGRFARIKY